jgi:hypothetical protein
MRKRSRAIARRWNRLITEMNPNTAGRLFKAMQCSLRVSQKNCIRQTKIACDGSPRRPVRVCLPQVCEIGLLSANRSSATTRRRESSREISKFWKVGGQGPTEVRATISPVERKNPEEQTGPLDGYETVLPYLPTTKTKPKRNRGRAWLEPKRQAKHEPITDLEMAELCPTHTKRTRIGTLEVPLAAHP